MPDFKWSAYYGHVSFSETLFLFLLALLVFGPKKLPEIARQVGKALNELRRASNEFKAQIEAEISQLEVEEMRKQGQQKILPPAEPPSEAVPSSRFAPPSEALPTVNHPAEKPSNA